MTDSIAVNATYRETARPNHTAAEGAAAAAIGLICVLLFLLVNPFLAVFVLAVLSIYRRVPNSIFIASASVSFALFFYFRDYGVLWYYNSSDDVPNYVSLYHDLLDAPLSQVIAKFIDAPNGYELLWQLPWWGLANVFDASDYTFIFVHYLAIFVAVFLALNTLSARYLIALVAVYFFLMPTSVDSIAHIWRQQLAFSMYLAGMGLYLIRGRRIGQWLIFLSPLMHLSLIFFVAGYLAFRLIDWSGGFSNKLQFSILLILIMGVVPFLAKYAVGYLDAIGLQRVMSYLEAAGPDSGRVYKILGVYMVPLLAAFYLLKNDETNNLIMVLCFSVFSIVASIPAANGLYERLLMFVLPLLGIHFFRCLKMNFSAQWQLPFIVLSFVVGSIRLYLPTLDQSGPMYFLAYGHALDPLMGVLKMFVVL